MQIGKLPPFVPMLQALAWPFLDEQERLVWAAVLEFDAVPTQEGQREGMCDDMWFEVASPVCVPGVAPVVLPASQLHPPPARPGSRKKQLNASS